MKIYEMGVVVLLKITDVNNEGKIYHNIVTDVNHWGLKYG